MEAKKLKELFEKYLNMINLGDYYLYSDLELYHVTTGESRFYKTVEEVIADKEVNALLDGIQFNIFSGGRGASSGKGGKGDKGGLGGGFTSAKDGPDKSYSANPAPFNYGGRSQNLDSVVSKFINDYGSAKREYAVSVDDQGFAHSYRIGNAHSVSIIAGPGHTVVHNHPSGGNFSKADLLNTAGSNRKGIIATNKDSYYHFEKTQKFDAKGFTKAVNNAKWPKKMSYDEGADWWLRKNASKFGYKYDKKKPGIAGTHDYTKLSGGGYISPSSLPF